MPFWVKSRGYGNSTFSDRRRIVVFGTAEQGGGGAYSLMTSARRQQSRRRQARNILGAGGARSVSDILGGRSPAELLSLPPSPPCTFRAARAQAAPSLVFGGGNDTMKLTRSAASDIVERTDARWRKEIASGNFSPSPEAVRAIRQDAVLMDFALAAALDIAPWRRNDGVNLYYDRDASGGAHRIQKIRKTGDCWVYRKLPDNPVWHWNFYRRDAMITIAELSPILADFNPRRAADYRKICLWFLILGRECGRASATKPANTPGKERKIYGRLAFLRLAAKHPSLSLQTRIILGVQWCAARGYLCQRKPYLAAKMAARAAGLPEDEQFLRKRVFRILSLFRSEMWDLLSAKTMPWREFLSWQSRVNSRLAAGGHAAEFRVMITLWRCCLTRERGLWRWTGWHLIPGGDLRRHAQAAKRVATTAGCCKPTAARALSFADFAGLFVFSGAWVSMSPGIWGKTLKAQTAAAADYIRERLTVAIEMTGALARVSQGP